MKTDSTETKVVPRADSSQSPCSEVFEIADTTDIGGFHISYTLGFYPTLVDAISAIESHKEPWKLCEDDSFYNGCAEIEIRKRKVGVLKRKVRREKCLWRREWRTRDGKTWDIFLPNAPHHQQPEERP